MCPAHLDRYFDLITFYANRYGTAAWLIIYQADTRCRCEHADRLRRELQSVHNMGGSREFDPDSPWNAVWRKMATDTAFWQLELVEPASMVLAKSTHISAVVDGDAPVAQKNRGKPVPPATPSSCFGFWRVYQAGQEV